MAIRALLLLVTLTSAFAAHENMATQDRGEVRVQVRSEAFREIRAMLKSGVTREEILACLDHETPNSEQSQGPLNLGEEQLAGEEPTTHLQGEEPTFVAKIDQIIHGAESLESAPTGEYVDKTPTEMRFTSSQTSQWNDGWKKWFKKAAPHECFSPGLGCGSGSGWSTGRLFGKGDEACKMLNFLTDEHGVCDKRLPGSSNEDKIFGASSCNLNRFSKSPCFGSIEDQIIKGKCKDKNKSEKGCSVSASVKTKVQLKGKSFTTMEIAGKAANGNRCELIAGIHISECKTCDCRPLLNYDTYAQSVTNATGCAEWQLKATNFIQSNFVSRFRQKHMQALNYRCGAARKLKTTYGEQFDPEL